MESCCRACSRSDDFRRFSLYAVAEVSQEVIANMIRDTSDTQVSTEDGLPQHICPDCLMTLSLAYSFRKQCRRSEAKFREYWGRRTPAQSVDQQQQQQHQSQQQNLPRRSQSQVPDDSSFEAVATNIKEEVDIYDYEYSVPSVHDNQWVIQNPRTIGEGAMTVVHNTGGQYYDEAATSGEPAGAPDREGQGMIHAMDDAPEMGESSGLGLKAGDKLKKNVPNPERYSQRIRRQEISSSMTGSAPRYSETGDWGRFSVSVIPEASLLASTSAPAVGSNPSQQQRCQHCKKKMKKPYKHRNGKCLEPKNKSSSRPKCAYCHQTFSSSKGIPSHLRNSCRVYRQVCEAKGINIPAAEQSSSPYDTSSVPSETPEPARTKAPQVVVPPVLNAKPATSDQKSKPKRPQTTGIWNIVCQYCNRKFLKKSALNRHLQKQCLVWIRRRTERLSAKNVTTSVPLPLPAPSSSSLDDKSAIVKDPIAQVNQRPVVIVEQLTKCVYCQQSVSKKTRFLHHNGRCVLGRVNADHQCPHCPKAFVTRNLLLKHRCDLVQKKQKNSTKEPVKTISMEPERKQRRLAKLTPKQIALVKTKTPVKHNTSRKVLEFQQETPTSIVKREFCTHCRQRIRDSDRQKHAEKRCFNNNEVSYNCGYCRKGFSARDSLIEHQRICTVRKQHKQVKCQFCGSMISNRGNLKKHQKAYCKSLKQPEDVKLEKIEKPDKTEKSHKLEKPQKLAKPIKSEKPLKLKKVKNEELVKKKKKIKREKSNHSKSPDDEMENIPLKQRKLHKPLKSNVARAKSSLIESKKPMSKLASSNKKYPSFPCEYCKLKFDTESLIRKHLQRCSVKRDAAAIVCQHCSQRFSRQGNLDRHLRLKCKLINQDNTTTNKSINELKRPDTANSVNSTLEENEEQEESMTEPADQEQLDLPSETNVGRFTEPSKESCPEPVRPSTPSTSEQTVQSPVEIPADQPQDSPMLHEAVDEVPEPVQEEIILQDDQLPTSEDDMEEVDEDVMNETDPPAEESVEQPSEVPPDEHPQTDNNNAEREKSSTPEVRLPQSVTDDEETTVIDSHDYSHRTAEDVLSDFEQEPASMEPMQVDHSVG
ncbi:uncharacterized protein LOC134213625 isoform X2 [Armigeres subalbatus]|uniref:uncharacterized protein LOC134213625 isoform X2 n=1 Tax=Armigeres subalbatus TaxID=124917 RepID=UPI002ED208E9